MNKVIYKMGLVVGRFFAGSYNTYEEVVEALEDLAAMARKELLESVPPSIRIDP